VQLHLAIDGQRIELAQVGGERLFFDKPTTIRPGPAEIVMLVDGQPRRWGIEIIELPGPARVVPFRFA
jgi:hypothetical protein